MLQVVSAKIMVWSAFQNCVSNPCKALPEVRYSTVCIWRACSDRDMRDICVSVMSWMTGVIDGLSNEILFPKFREMDTKRILLFRKICKEPISRNIVFRETVIFTKTERNDTKWYSWTKSARKKRLNNVLCLLKFMMFAYLYFVFPPV